MTESRLMAFVTEPGRIDFQEVPIPVLEDLDVHIKVKACTICGSDLHIFRGAHPSVTLPVPVGHEIAGEVVAIGSDVRKVRVGDHVTVEPVIACGNCWFCVRGDYHHCENISFQYRVGQGGFTTDFVAIEKWVHLLPDDMTFLEGALVEPLSVGIHAVRKAGIGPGDDVAIFGAGPIGLMILQAAKNVGAGCTYIADLSEFRLGIAKALGADVTINSRTERAVDRIKEGTAGFGVTVGFEAVGVEITLHQMLQSIRKGGKGVLVGLFEEPEVKIPTNLLVQKEIALLGSQGYHWDFQRSIRWTGNRQIDLNLMVTHQFPLEQAQEAFDLLERPGNAAVKVAILP